MSVRRQTENRFTLVRECGGCGRTFPTTASTPWIRQMPKFGKKQATVYFCSSACYKASYKHIGWYDGKAKERRDSRERSRDISAKNKRYYEAHRESEKQRQRDKYWSNPEAARKDMVYAREKRRLLQCVQ